MSQKNHTQKIWLITGASRGFGKIWATAALERGDKVAATARRLSTLDDLKQTYGDLLLPLQLDVTDREAVFATVKQAQQHFGRLDVVLSNAGFGYMAEIEEAEMADTKTMFETNVFGTLSVIQAALPILRAQGSGHILPVSSVAGQISMPTSGVYSAAKFAVEGLAEALSAEVKQFGINVTIIEPGGYATNFLDGSSLKTAPAIADYDPLRAELAAMLTEDSLGVPEASATAILKVVDSQNPPLRLILGDLLPFVKQIYSQRLETWDAWDDVARAAKGK